MPPPKKAAKKAAKKSAKHMHDRRHDDHKHGKDLRRAYEHLGRVDGIQALLQGESAKTVAVLVALAQQQISGGHNRDAADLLRGAEHLAFATLAKDESKSPKPSADLLEAIGEQYEELHRRADEHWNLEASQPAELKTIYLFARKASIKAFKERSYHQALEFARAAEALAHVEGHGPQMLESGSQPGKVRLNLTHGAF